MRKFRATFASAVVASSCAKGRCLTENWPFYTSAIAVCIMVGSLVASVLRQSACVARRIASVIKSGFIRASVHHFTSATLRRFHRRRLLHATDFSKQPLRSALAVPCIAKRRGKCHGIFSTFSRSRRVILAVTLPSDSGLASKKRTMKLGHLVSCF